MNLPELISGQVGLNVIYLCPRGNMKRGIGLIAIILLCAAGCLYVWRDTPFVPVLGIAFFALAVILLAISLYSRMLITSGGKLLRETLSPVIAVGKCPSNSPPKEIFSNKKVVNDIAVSSALYVRTAVNSSNI